MQPAVHTQSTLNRSSSIPSPFFASKTQAQIGSLKLLHVASTPTLSAYHSASMRPQNCSLLSLLSFSTTILAAPRPDVFTETSSALAPRDSFEPTIPLGQPCQISANCPSSCCTIWGGVKQCVSPPKFGVSKPVVICIVETLPPDDPEPASASSSSISIATSSISTSTSASSTSLPSVVSSTTSLPSPPQTSTSVLKRSEGLSPREADWLPTGQPCQISANCPSNCCTIWDGVRQCVSPPLGTIPSRWLCMAQPVPIESSTDTAEFSQTSPALANTSPTSTSDVASLTTLLTTTTKASSNRALTPRNSSRPVIPLGQPCVISANCPSGCCTVWNGVKQCVNPPSDNIGLCLVAPSIPLTTGGSKA